MVNRLKCIFNSAMCELSMLVVTCCMVVNMEALKHSGAWTGVAVGSALAGGVVLAVLLVWATVMIAAGKTVSEMPPRPRVIVETASRLLFLCWLFIATSLPFALVWLAFIIWDGVRSIREAF